MKMIEHLGGRKFVATIGCGLATTLLQWHMKLDPAGNTYMLVIVATVGAYIAGNVVQKKQAGDAQ